MYYGDFARIQRMERLLERLAYLSVVLDFMVAIATYLVTRGVQYSAALLMLSGYLIIVEVVLAGVLFAALIAIKHYRKIIDSIALSTFRSNSNITRYAGKGVGVVVLVLRRIYREVFC